MDLIGHGTLASLSPVQKIHSLLAVYSIVLGSSTPETSPQVVDVLNVGGTSPGQPS
jgi:hypothetical protein